MLGLVVGAVGLAEVRRTGFEGRVGGASVWCAGWLGSGLKD